MKNFQSPAGLVQIKPVQVKYAAPLFQAIATSRKNIATFLPWANDLSLKDEKDFLYQEKAKLYHGQPLVFTLIVAGQPAGMLDLHAVDENNRSAEIGYWLSVEHQNQGIVSRAVEEIKQYAFDRLALQKLILKIDPNNQASQRVAEKAAFEKTGLANGFVCYELNQ
ncbi:GNAT family N-acetyltransferase [Fructobacillus papyrifericola]|uniref:GNAT family N-acetyltransferase n=1 Tax=Fructobacillus papyrifericola TaxID=2713172 RepID=A0ABS5QRM1_9LACO|nr:GNAT family protein [Fructobacillus papyrifericola]MBS9335841.1 GNAT family N-acetyltransferase [Fructobacillus papyrifericola]